MDRVEAASTLSQHLAQYRGRSYNELSVLVDGPPETAEIVAPSGIRYQVEVLIVWDSKPGQNIRVLGSIDDGGWRALMPQNDDFIMAPDGSFVGES